MYDIIILFSAVENGDIHGFGDTFEFLTYAKYDGAIEVGFCNLMPNGDVNDGTQDGCLDGEYSVNLFPNGLDVLYVNNEDGSAYDLDEFTNEFVNNPKWQLVGLHGYLETV